MHFTAWVMSNYMPTHGLCVYLDVVPSFIFIWLDALNF